MHVAAILVMWHRCGEQTFITLTHWGSMWNLALIVPVVSEEKMFEAFSLYVYEIKVTPGVGPFLNPGLQFE